MDVNNAVDLIHRIAQTQNDIIYNPLRCPRCGSHSIRNPLIHNALSRHADVYICNDCGVNEMVRDLNKNPLPLTEWFFAKAYDNVRWEDGTLRAIDPIVTDDGSGVECTFECWFDADAKFGENTDGDDSAWIQLYATYYPANDRLKMEYTVTHDDYQSYFHYKPTDREKTAVIAEMENACKREGCKSFQAFIESVQ